MNQVNVAIEILSALLAGGFILFFVENQHIERDVIDRFRAVMDPYYHKLSCYLKFVFSIKDRLRYLSTDSNYVQNFKTTIEKFDRKGGDVYTHSNNVSFMDHKELNSLNESINNVWWLYNEANVRTFITKETRTEPFFADSEISETLSEIFVRCNVQTIDANLLSAVSSDFYVKIWQPVQYVTWNYEYWDKKCRFNKRILLCSLSLVMLVMIMAMLFSANISSYFITISTICCCAIFIFVLLQLNKLMRLSHNIFGQLPSWKSNDSTKNKKFKNIYSKIFRTLRELF